eukprot:755109-Hanusia_phi.AAC.5
MGTYGTTHVVQFEGHLLDIALSKEGKKDHEEIAKLTKRIEKLSHQVLYMESKNKILENENRALTEQASADRQLASFASTYSSAAVRFTILAT